MRAGRETSECYSVSSSGLTTALMVFAIHNRGYLSHG